MTIVQQVTVKLYELIIHHILCLIFKHTMQVDINQSRSRAFNLFLRFMQLGFSLVAAIQIAKFDSNTCNNSFYKLIQACSILLTLISLFANLYFRCRDGFNKTFFFVILGTCIILAGIILIVSFAGYGQSQVCAGNRITFKFMVVSIITLVIMSLFILFASFYWIQRYTNSPGNIVWVIMFLLIEWNDVYKTNLIVIGCLCLVVTLLTLSVNTLAAFKGITTLIKKVIVFGWAIGLVIMFVNEILAIAAYMQNSDHRDYTDVMAKKLLQIFVIVNVIQFAMWMYGLITLQHENGDMVRDSLLNFSSNRESGRDPWREEDGGQGIGTLK